jgi:hypothetical protein
MVKMVEVVSHSGLRAHGRHPHVQREYSTFTQQNTEWFKSYSIVSILWKNNTTHSGMRLERRLVPMPNVPSIPFRCLLLRLDSSDSESNHISWVDKYWRGSRPTTSQLCVACASPTGDRIRTCTGFPGSRFRYSSLCCLISPAALLSLPITE